MSNQNDLHPDTIEGERGMPSVNDRAPSKVKSILVLFGLFLIVGAGAGAAYWKHKQRTAREAEAQQAKSMQVTNALPARTFTDPPPVKASTPLMTQESLNKPTTAPPLPGNMANSGGAPSTRLAPELDKSGSGLMAVSQKGKAAEQPDGRPPIQPEKSSSEGGGLGALLSSTKTPPRMAGHLGNRNFILAKGSFIDCALQTKLDSTVPGMSACVVTRNIYSDNGKVLLVERGSTITGEYQSNMRQGMARIFVLWSRIKTPNGIVINLDSPGTDPLGGSGLPGWVDNHFWERFGGALMLSLVDDVARFATQNTDNNSGQINFSSTGEATQNMATEALKNTINIPPTLYKNQGEQVGVYVARDLDFSSVYDVESN